MMRIRLTEFPNLSANELRVPNGVGSWSVDKFGIAYAEGAFLMYVEKINPHFSRKKKKRNEKSANGQNTADCRHCPGNFIFRNGQIEKISGYRR